MFKTYDELILLPTFEERFNYCKLNGAVAAETFGGHRLLNQLLYNSYDWKRIRQKVILRDNGCDLAIEDRPIIKPNKLLIHHINPITIEQIENHDPLVFDLNNLITVSQNTHNAIHYGDSDLLIPTKAPERTANDTTPWK